MGFWIVSTSTDAVVSDEADVVVVDGDFMTDDDTVDEEMEPGGFLGFCCLLSTLNAASISWCAFVIAFFCHSTPVLHNRLPLLL
jgi:hypothetical protein